MLKEYAEKDYPLLLYTTSKIKKIISKMPE